MAKRKLQPTATLESARFELGATQAELVDSIRRSLMHHAALLESTIPELKEVVSELRKLDALLQRLERRTTPAPIRREEE